MGRVTRRVPGVVVVAVVCLVSITGCGERGPHAGPTDTTAGCSPIGEPHLVVLADDKKLQAANNIIPAVNAAAATPDLIAALNRASDALTTTELIGLNKATDVDRKTSKGAAGEFATRMKLTDGITRGSGGHITIGASSVSESQTLSFVYQIALNAAGYEASVQPVGSREQYEPALETGEVDVVPEYLSTLTEFLNRKVNGAAAAPLASGDTDKTVAALTTLGDKLKLAFGKPAAATAQNAFAVTKALADRHGLKTLSDFAAKCSGQATVLAGPEDCSDAGYCQPGLEETYGLKVGQVLPLDAGGPKTKEALTGGAATIGLVFSSDAALAG